MSKSKKLKLSHSCGAVVWRQSDDGHEILLIKQFSHKDSWGIPKGHMDKGETFEQCALREVREETGIDIELGSKLPECETLWKDEHKVVISFLAKQIGNSTPNTTDPDCEVADARWFKTTDLPKIHIYQQSLIAHVVSILKGFDESKE